jgi:hypothetical protein
MHPFFETRYPLVDAGQFREQRILIPFDQIANSSSLPQDFRAKDVPHIVDAAVEAGVNIPDSDIVED